MIKEKEKKKIKKIIKDLKKGLKIKYKATIAIKLILKTGLLKQFKIVI
jgi:hypothetical protein